MQKKLIALAVAAALTAPALALADSGNVTVYGLLSADVESVKNTIPATSTTAANNVSRTAVNRVTSNASRFGVKGEEALGDGLSAIFQIETRVNLLGNETVSTGTSSTGALAPATNATPNNTNLGVFNGLRNSNVGLKGGFGTVFLGHWDTPYKVSHNKVELFDNTSIATATALIGSDTKGSTANFNLRQNSSVQYWSPMIAGFQVKGAYSTANAPAATASNISPTQGAKLASISATYEDEMFYAALASESHVDFRGAGLSDNGARLVGAFKFEGGQVGLTYETLKLAAATGAKDSRNAIELSAKYSIGSNNFGAFVANAGNLGNTINTKAHQASVRYGYNLSKRTEAYALYTAISNATGANYGIADVTNGVVAGNGSRISGFGVGAVHTF